MRPTPNPRRPIFRARRGGFALLVTLTLLAFLVILLVGLATYTRVESAIAGNTQHQAQARQNALLALAVAHAQLQQHAGPDQRVTATAESFGGADGTKHYTGVWDATSTGPAARTWLVSGNEKDPLKFMPTAPASATAELVGAATSGTPGDVVAPKVNIEARGLPGKSGPATIGRYAWWVGDQGVKAPVAVADRTNEITYPPYDSAELRSRLRQQMGLGAGPASFEPRDAANAALSKNISVKEQLAFMKKADGAAIGTTEVRQNYHAWSPNNFAVLADAKAGGLKKDLSLNPGALGPWFETWANYKAYMEDVAQSAPNSTPAILPAYGPDPTAPDPLRRRYRMTPSGGAGGAGIAPVLTYFYVLVGVRRQNATQFTVSLRWAAALWNPYSSALVPEDLRLEISGLPTRVEFFNATTQVVAVTANLRALYGDPLTVTLPWTPPTPAEADKQSWLPGRTYNWTFLPNAVLSSGDNPGRFDSRDLEGFADGLTVSVPGAIATTAQLTIRVPAPTTLRVRLARASDGATLGNYTSPEYGAVASTDPFAASNSRSQLGFLFRLAESVDTVATPSVWLTTEGNDVRNETIPPSALVAVPNGPSPELYANFITINAPDRFFDRDKTRGTSYNEDVPLFELPRAPLLSVGQLQHLYVFRARPFAIGNPWGATAQIYSITANATFDRFFFSGLANPPSDLAITKPLPNSLLSVLPRSGENFPITLADIVGAPDGRSSKHFLQGGAFDVNSTRTAAWDAVLRSVRFGETAFNYVAADSATGTGGDESPETMVSASAQFFRFPQSAQEVFKADDDYEQSTTSTTSAGPVINTPLFRRGVRSLNSAQVASLASAIAGGIQVKQAESGPFRSMEEFLAAHAVLENRSVIEKAIADAGLNAEIPEFSSQFLTQGDIMTALAPVLFPRSDTFVIRAYGEAVNPATNATEGRAWCEATVQRYPDYFDSSQPAETLPADLNPTNTTYGRRFKIVSFRWLTRSDI